MVREAILELRDRQGSSAIKLEKYIIDNFTEISFKRHYLRKVMQHRTPNAEAPRSASWVLRGCCNSHMVPVLCVARLKLTLQCLKTNTDNGKLIRVRNSWKLSAAEKKRRR